MLFLWVAFPERSASRNRPNFPALLRTAPIGLSLLTGHLLHLTLSPPRTQPAIASGSAIPRGVNSRPARTHARTQTGCVLFDRRSLNAANEFMHNFLPSRGYPALTAFLRIVVVVVVVFGAIGSWWCMKWEDFAGIAEMHRNESPWSVTLARLIVCGFLLGLSTERNRTNLLFFCNEGMDDFQRCGFADGDRSVARLLAKQVVGS